MTKHHDGYDPNCPGCQVALIDVTTGKVMHEDHPLVQAAQRVLAQASKPEQDAYINVCVNKQAVGTAEMAMAKGVVRRMQAAFLLVKE